MDFEIDRKMDCSIIKLLTVLYLKIFNEYQLKTKKLLNDIVRLLHLVVSIGIVYNIESFKYRFIIDYNVVICGCQAQSNDYRINLVSLFTNLVISIHTECPTIIIILNK